MIKKMNFYKAWYVKTKKAVIGGMLLFCLFVLIAVYALNVCT